MRVTVELSEVLFRRAQREALDRGITLRALIEAALARELAWPAEAAPRFQPDDFVLVPPRPGAAIDPTKAQLDDWL